MCLLLSLQKISSLDCRKLPCTMSAIIWHYQRRRWRSPPFTCSKGPHYTTEWLCAAFNDDASKQVTHISSTRAHVALAHTRTKSLVHLTLSLIMTAQKLALSLFCTGDFFPHLFLTPPSRKKADETRERDIIRTHTEHTHPQGQAFCTYLLYDVRPSGEGGKVLPSHALEPWRRFRRP